MLLFPEVWMVLLLYGINVLITILLLVCLWYAFVKMGQPGWKGIVPFYNFWVLTKTLKKPMRWFWIQIACLGLFLIAFFFFLGGLVLTLEMETWEFFPMMKIQALVMGVSLLVALVYGIMIYHALSKSFGYGAGFTVGMVLLPVVFFPILAFGKSEFTEPEYRNSKVFPAGAPVSEGEVPDPEIEAETFLLQEENPTEQPAENEAEEPEEID